jgi:pimeloyl-ACP methyl ester carboxylesterase
VSPTPPETRYAKSGEIHIAYQVVGEGPFDLLLVPGWVSHVEYAWEEPGYADFLRRLASFSRLLLLDRRGTGLSDPVAKLPTLEERMDDVRAVMDAAGSSRAALLGVSEGGPMCALFAATYPERTTALVLCNTFARNVIGEGYPFGHTRQDWESFLERVEETWGKGFLAALFAPSFANDPDFRKRWGRFERLGVSPGGARMLMRMAMENDVRGVLPSVRVPTLIVHREGDAVAPVEGARYLAEQVPGARLVELPGGDHFPWVGDVEDLVGEVQEFLTGERTSTDQERVLATVVFIDVAGSTEALARLGDARFSEVLARYHALASAEVRRLGGRVIDTAGDGVFASFDGPARAIRCACAVRDGVESLQIAVRAGLHTGECQRMGERMTGIAVHLGARVAAEADPGEVLVSSTVRDLVAGSGLQFAERGTRVLKGVPGEWRLFAVVRPGAG